MESQSPAPDTPKAEYQSIPVHQITTSRHQARKDFDQEGLIKLSESMKAEGLIQPITVRIVSAYGRTGVSASQQENEVTPTRSDAETPTQYELVSGERRWRAAQLLGWKTIEAKIIQTVSEAEAAAKGLVENLQREDLNPIEEAQGFVELNRLDPTYWTQAKIGEITGKTQSQTSRSIRFLDLPEQVKENMRIRIIASDNGAELVRLPNADLQLKVANMIVQKGLNSKATRKIVDGLIKPKKAPRQPIQSAGVSFMAPFWPNLMANTSIDACGYWKVEFKKDGWHFIASDTKFGAPGDFTAWFRQLADAMANLAVIPAKAGIQNLDGLDPGLRRGDDSASPLSDEEEQLKAVEEDAIMLRQRGIGGFNQ
jgi:ParB family chromosome partitioning protein